MKRSLDSRSKKGNIIVDSVYFMVIIAILLIVVVVAVFLNNILHDVFVNNEIVTGQAKTILENNTSLAPSLFDYMIGTVFGLFWLLGIIASYYQNSHPIFFMVVMLIIIVELVVGAYLSSGIDNAMSTDMLISSYNALPITKHLTQHFAMYMTAMAVTIGFVLYAKRSQ
jgi:hypothetical protein